MRAQQLKQKFGVYGHFYNFRIGDQLYPCRSLLEIVSHDITPLRLSDLVGASSLNAIALMMNPGSSKPIDKTYLPRDVSSVEEITLYREIVPTIPDVTQYQIMKIMAAVGWAHVRVLNLSDLRCSKSTDFIARVAALGDVAGGDVHSMFCEARSEERLELLERHTHCPIVVAWGQDKALLPLARQCLLRLNGRRIIGVPVANEPSLFQHASPMLQRMKDAWLRRIIQAIAVS